VGKAFYVEEKVKMLGKTLSHTEMVVRELSSIADEFIEVSAMTT
jgi:hypothetical protein